MAYHAFLFLLTSAVLIPLAYSALNSKTTVVTCTTSTACHPWSPQGPACGRGNRMNLRFMLTVGPENFQTLPGYAEPATNVTYPFCPVVDELQAFNITDIGPITYVYDAGVTQDPLTLQPMTDWKHTSLTYAYISAIGLGEADDVEYPGPNSQGKAMIADNVSTKVCLGGVGVVEFLVLNVSMSKGKFVYTAGHNQPGGVGFMPSCDANDVCLYDVSMKCIGDQPGRKNCGTCIDDTQELSRMKIQVWTSYYGTDSRGRQLRSGAQNPLNFQAFSGTGVYSSMSKSYNNIQEGRGVGEDDELSPDAADAEE